VNEKESDREMENDVVKLAPSILAADFARLGEQVTEAEQAGADRIHVDVMDGHFVPNLSMGAPIVQSLRRVTHLPLEIHLMISDPDFFLDEFVEAGSDLFLVHLFTGKATSICTAHYNASRHWVNGPEWSSTRPPQRRCWRKSCKMSSRC
jgi:ribulose-phosphate 3-epimerase